MADKKNYERMFRKKASVAGGLLFTRGISYSKLVKGNAKNRTDKLAIKKAEKEGKEGKEYNHFVFHDLKRKGVSDTTGNKLEASGHRSPSQLKIYDVKPSVVDEAGK